MSQPSPLDYSDADSATTPLAPEATLLSLANLNKSCGDPLRLRILRALSTDSFGVLELCDIFDIKQSSMSHHLKVLTQAGTIVSRREGNSIFYSRAHRPQSGSDTLHSQLLHHLFDTIDHVHVGADIERNMETVQQQRANAARAFFNRHAQEFQTQQELIADFEQYAQTALDFLLKSAPQDYLLDIGSGNGAFLAHAAPHFDRMVALDISEQMLDQAKALTREQKLEHVDFILGDTQDAVNQLSQAHHIVCNMVLHHVPSPATVFKDCARLLAPEGALVITDLCRHDQQWAKDNCGDLWLGFAPEELERWAINAGLRESDSHYLALRNGFQIQTRRFTPINTTLPRNLNP